MSIETHGKVSAWLGSAVVAATLAMTAPAMAQDTCAYPEQPVTIVVGFAPGGGTDSIARILANELTQLGNGQPYNVVNKEGGAQVTAMKYVIDSDKDGYTIQFFSAGSAGLSTILRDPGFSFTEAFQPVGNVAISKSVLAVNSESPIETGQDMLDWIKESYAAGNKLRYSHAGRGSSSHISIAAWLDINGVYEMVQDVPFEGSGPGRAALIGNQVDFAGMNVTNVHRFDELRGVGLLSDERDPLVDYVPTMREQGVAFVDMDGPLLLSAPTGVSQEILDCLEASVKEVSESPSFIEAMDKIGYAVIYRDAATSAESLDRLVASWTEVIGKVMDAATN